MNPSHRETLLDRPFSVFRPNEINRLLHEFPVVVEATIVPRPRPAVPDPPAVTSSRGAQERSEPESAEAQADVQDPSQVPELDSKAGLSVEGGTKHKKKGKGHKDKRKKQQRKKTDTEERRADPIQQDSTEQPAASLAEELAGGEQIAEEQGAEEQEECAGEEQAEHESEAPGPLDEPAAEPDVDAELAIAVEHMDLGTAAALLPAKGKRPAPQTSSKDAAPKPVPAAAVPAKPTPPKPVEPRPVVPPRLEAREFDPAMTIYPALKPGQCVFCTEPHKIDHCPTLQHLSDGDFGMLKVALMHGRVSQARHLLQQLNLTSPALARSSAPDPAPAKPVRAQQERQQHSEQRPPRQVQGLQRRDQYNCCLHCQQEGHFVRQCPVKDGMTISEKVEFDQKYAGRRRDLQVLQCYYCGGKSHSFDDCPALANWGKAERLELKAAYQGKTIERASDAGRQTSAAPQEAGRQPAAAARPSKSRPGPKLESGAFPALDTGQQPAKAAADPASKPAAPSAAKPAMSFAAALSGKATAKPGASAKSEAGTADSRDASQRGDWEAASLRKDSQPARPDAEDVVRKSSSLTGGWDGLLEDESQQPQAEGHTSGRSSLEDDASRPFSRAPGSQRSAAKPIVLPRDSFSGQPAPAAHLGNHHAPQQGAYSTSPIAVPPHAAQQQSQPDWLDASTQPHHMQWQAAQQQQPESSLWKPHPDQLAQVQQQAWDRAPGRQAQQAQPQQWNQHEELPAELYAQLPEPWRHVHDSISLPPDAQSYPSLPPHQLGPTQMPSPASSMTSQTLDEHMRDAPPAQHGRSASGHGPPPSWGAQAGSSGAKAGSSGAKEAAPAPPGFARPLPTSHPPGFAAQALHRQASGTPQPPANGEAAPAEQQRPLGPPPRPVSLAQEAGHQRSSSDSQPQAWGYPPPPPQQQQQQQQFRVNGPVPLHVAAAPPRPLSQPGSYTPHSPQGKPRPVPIAVPPPRPKPGSFPAVAPPRPVPRALSSDLAKTSVPATPKQAFANGHMQTKPQPEAQDSEDDMSFWLSSIGVSAPQQQQQQQFEAHEIMASASSGSSSTMQLAEPLAIEAAPSAPTWADRLQGDVPDNAKDERAAAARREDEQEDADLQQAIQASLEPSSRPHQQLLEDARAFSHAAAGSSSPAVAAGLQNNIGEYNCFLNVILQCLWRCRAFQSGILGQQPHLLEADPIVAALLHLFLALKEADAVAEDDASDEGSQEHGQRKVVDPSELREALSQLDGGLPFRLGEMNDAAEVLGALYESLEHVSGGRDFVDTTFGLQVAEGVECGACKLTTHRNAYTQRFYNASATALRFQLMACETPDFGVEPGLPPPLAELLAMNDQQQCKSCDEDAGGCGQMRSLSQALQGRAPQVFTLQLAWERLQERVEDINATMSCIQEELDLSSIYEGVPKGSSRYMLRSMVGFYGSHYCALARDDRLQQWLYLDDALVSAIGNWGDVLRKCQRGHIQPSVLFFERV